MAGRSWPRYSPKPEALSFRYTKKTFPPCVGAERSFVLCRPAYTGGREYPQAGSADSGKMGRLDHHLTAPSSQPVPCIVFHAPTFSYNHHKQRRKLCTLHNFRRWFIVFPRPSQFSDQTTTSNWAILKCVFDAWFPPRTVLF